MRFSAFSRFGHFRFSGKRPVGQTIYESMRASMGGDENLGEETFSGPMCAHMFATSMALATAQRTIDKTNRERVPHTSDEFLERYERDYRVTPRRTDTRDERRVSLRLAEQLSDGCNAAALTEALETLLGDGFVALRTHDETEFVVSPADWDTTGPGAWKRPNFISKWHRLTAAVAPGTHIVHSSSILGDASLLKAGDVVIVEPGAVGIQEKLTLTSLGALTAATFAHAHAAGTVITTEPWPWASSTSRVVLVVVTYAVATSKAWHKKIGSLLRKKLRAVDQWYVTTETSSGWLGPFYPDAVLPAGVSPGIPGITPLIAIPTT